MVLEREVPLLSLIDVWPSHWPQVLGMACGEKQHLTQRDTRIFLNILWRKIFDYKICTLLFSLLELQKDFVLKYFYVKHPLSALIYGNGKMGILQALTA